ncbi:hypothetical protein SBOR_4599 [Sclerotinia borealis F-4128]|uniref:Uncharacterized protein n=1 Tax=Sclerotinia borealis (strain F-4128) TaxID=1432307 RepID=W9CJY5_SCLBF|nr:hypothetical protein SBOR_4599 [Sclerotinia borealis F-4128]
MTDLNIEASIASPIYFPILTQHCPTLVLQILCPRNDSNITTDITRKQRPRILLMFPGNYTPPTAISGDQPCNGLLLQLNPYGNSGRAKCTVRVSKARTLTSRAIQYTMHIQFYGTVYDLLTATRDVFGEGNPTFRYRLSNGRLHGGRDFWLQVLIKCYYRQLIFRTNIEGTRYFWYPFECEWADGLVVSLRSIKKGQYPDESSRQLICTWPDAGLVNVPRVLEYNATNELCCWYPVPNANATAPGPVGGGHSSHPIFENYSTEENRAPVTYVSLLLPNEPLYYVMRDLNNGNVMFHDGQIYLINHLDANIISLSFITFVVYLRHKHLIKHLKLPQANNQRLINVQGAFWPPSSDDDEDDE